MKFENTEVFNFEGAFRGMRNPMESWEKSDSENWQVGESSHGPVYDFSIGEKDLALAQRLIRAGKDHRKFMRQIFVSVDITAPLYWWKEFDTYKVGTVANSTSTMHKLASTPITSKCFEVDEETLDDDVFGTFWHDIILDLEYLRNEYKATKDKRYWKCLIQLLPESWLQTRTVTMSYENLISIANSDRKHHKLTEWSKDFFEWMHTLPYSDELIFLDLTPKYIQDSVLRLEDIADLVSKNLSDSYFLSEAILQVARKLKGEKDESED